MSFFPCLPLYDQREFRTVPRLAEFRPYPLAVLSRECTGYSFIDRLDEIYNVGGVETAAIFLKAMPKIAETSSGQNHFVSPMYRRIAGGQ
jgi:hypothetical protein